MLSSNALFLLIVILFTIHNMAFTFGHPPAWLQLSGALGTILILVRIARGDD